MKVENKLEILKYEKGRLYAVTRAVVREFPLRLIVNGRELAILIVSPHQLDRLVAGFLRLQGFIQNLDDLLSFGICADSGRADIRIRGDVPEQLMPVLTSGCGAGITFSLPETMKKPSPEDMPAQLSPAAIFRLMQELAQKAEQYRNHGGMHSAAVGDGRSLLIYAEDVGRHNAIDRLAGEALFRHLDLRGMLLVTSGRVSSEMLTKAACLGIVVVASRTSVTDLAVRMAEQAGITLISYLRGDSCEICTHPERLTTPHF